MRDTAALPISASPSGDLWTLPGTPAPEPLSLAAHGWREARLTAPVSEDGEMQDGTPVEAVEAAPWRPGEGPAPRVRTYSPGSRPLLEIYIGGRWRRCLVQGHYDWPDGRVAYQVQVQAVGGDGLVGMVIRSYWWNPTAMRPVRSR